jgi:hypothetical protein
MVLPRGLVACRHYSAEAIGLAMVLYGLLGLTCVQTRERISPYKRVGDTAASGWAALGRWVRAIDHGRLFKAIRPCPSHWTLRQRAERVATSLAACSAGSAATIEAQVFAGARLAA